MKKFGGLKIAGPLDVENPGQSFGGGLRPFDEHDWDGFAGAQNFEDDNSPPLIGEVEVTGWPEQSYEGGGALTEAVIIVDAAGVSLNGMNGGVTNNRNVFGKTKEQLVQEAQQLMAHQPIDVQKLLDEGWDTQNLPEEPYEQPQVPIESSEKTSGCDHESLNNDHKCMQCGKQFTPESYEKFQQEHYGAVNRSDKEYRYTRELNSGVLPLVKKYNLDLAGPRGFGRVTPDHSMGATKYSDAEWYVRQDFEYDHAKKRDYKLLPTFSLRTGQGSMDHLSFEQLDAEIAKLEGAKTSASQQGEFDNDKRPSAVSHHTFVPRKNQAENSSCAVCSKKYDDVNHTKSAAAKTASPSQRAEYYPGNEFVTVYEWDGQHVGNVIKEVRKEDFKNEKKLGKWKFDYRDNVHGSPVYIYYSTEPEPGQRGPSVPSGSDAAQRHALGSAKSAEDFKKIKPGVVCSECGRDVTEGEYSKGESNCCHAGPIPADEFGQDHEAALTDEEKTQRDEAIERSEGEQDRELSEEVANRDKKQSIHWEGKDWEVEDGPHHSVRLIRWKSETDKSTGKPFRWIEDLVEMPKSYFDRYIKWGSSAKTAGDYGYKTEATTPDGYEIQSYSPFADPKQPRRFTVWPPAGNAVGDYASMDEANIAIHQWKQIGDPELLKRDGGAQFKVRKAGSKTAGPLDVENPGATFNTGQVPNAKVNRVIADLAAAMKDRSPQGALDITQDPQKHEEIEHAVRTMMQNGCQFTTKDIDWITWPVEPYEESIQGPPSDEARAQHEEFGQRIQAIPGYRELNEVLESFYQ